MSVNEFTYFDSARPGIVPRAIAALGQMFARYLAYRQQRADIATLHSLSDRELKDIGVYRCDVDRAAVQGRDAAINAALRARPASTMM